MQCDYQKNRQLVTIFKIFKLLPQFHSHMQTFALKPLRHQAGKQIQTKKKQNRTLQQRHKRHVIYLCSKVQREIS